MKGKKSNTLRAIWTLAFTLSTFTGQATVIIGGDILNGNLNAGSADGDTTDDNFQSTPNWVNVGGVATMQASRMNLPSPDGTRNAVLSLSGDRVFGSELGLNGYTIAAGDTFDVQFEWRDAFNWNNFCCETIHNSVDLILCHCRTRGSSCSWSCLSNKRKF